MEIVSGGGARAAIVRTSDHLQAVIFKMRVSPRDINIARSRITMPAILNQCDWPNAKRKSSSTIFW